MIQLMILLMVLGSISTQEYFNENIYEPTDRSALLEIHKKSNFFNNFENSEDVHSKDIRGRRIVNGAEVVPHSHPYQVALRMILETYRGVCGGTILTERSILTAAHCPTITSATLIIAGAHNIDNLESSQQRRLIATSGYRVHSHYDPRTFVYDIAILRLPTLLTFNNVVQPTRLPIDYANESFMGEMTRSIGWGSTGEKDYSPVLREAYNRVIPDSECGASNEHIICVDIVERDQGICDGDSGGALVVGRPGDFRAVQIGIAVTASIGCRSSPAAFIRVTSFLPWIEEHK